MKMSTQPRVPKKEIENEVFWQKHINAQKESGLSKLSYCQQNELDYARFHYWIRREKECASNPPLIAVKLKPTEQEPSITSNVLCTLELKDGAVLHIHRVQALEFILDRMH